MRNSIVTGRVGHYRPSAKLSDAPTFCSDCLMSSRTYCPMNFHKIAIGAKARRLVLGGKIEWKIS
jgi:hypothetical protein